MVASNPYVAYAWAKWWRTFFACLLISGAVSLPVGIWFYNLSKSRSKNVLEERHERGATMVDKQILYHEVLAYNRENLIEECKRHVPELDPKRVAGMPAKDRLQLGIHKPYMIAGVPLPWRTENNHAMFVGTTGAGKTTALKNLVVQARERGHRMVIFDLTGTFVESFYNSDTDTILNPADNRCPPWTVFADCQEYNDFAAAGAALLPDAPGGSDPFWIMAARTLFIEMCVRLVETGQTTNQAIIHNMIHADLKRLHALLKHTAAGAFTDSGVARLAESVRSVLTTNANALRFLKDPENGLEQSFSIRKWMMDPVMDGGILFITSNHNDLIVNRSLLTMWMDIAVTSLMRRPRTRDINCWFLFDEVHALHKLPAIQNGLQTARAYGGAFVLGIHSYDALSETYGPEIATTLSSLAGTKLILKTADSNTAKFCADMIGNREVRTVEEGYSYGANSTRDAATITARKDIQHLVIPDDIMNLPPMQGFIKFADGFPAAKIKLKWHDYPMVAPGYDRRLQIIKAPENLPLDDNAGDDDEGRLKGQLIERQAEDYLLAAEEGEGASKEEISAEASAEIGAMFGEKEGQSPEVSEAETERSADVADPDKANAKGAGVWTSPAFHQVLELDAAKAESVENAKTEQQVKHDITHKHVAETSRGDGKHTDLTTREMQQGFSTGQDHDLDHDIANDGPEI
jgi:type IV conjugative transfer system coupling protein TraD